MSESIKCDLEGGILSINIMDVFHGLTEEQRKSFLETYTFEEIIPFIERQLKHETGSDSWGTSGWRDGQDLRAAIVKIQGLEFEFKKDMESKIRALEHDSEYYKKFYDWYFKVYHLRNNSDEPIIAKLHKAIGDPTNV